MHPRQGGQQGAVHEFELVGGNIGGKLELRDSSDHKLFSEDLDPSIFVLLGVSYVF